MSEVAMITLIATGMPESGPGRRAVSTGRYSNAFSSGSRAFVFRRRPAAYSSAVGWLFPNRRRSSRTPASDLDAERAVGSVMPARPRTDESKTIEYQTRSRQRRGPISSPPQLDEFLHHESLVVRLACEIAERDLGVHRHLECVGGDVDAWRVDAVGEHPFHSGLHHDGVDRSKFLLSNLHRPGLDP